ncbi:hypothetical protein BX616_007849 [Lobosporangium transversale]|uniref:RlpA-like double-psi beta-barrel-protein domain-containing protein-containing protein n=1 Tax=Lobosporangium transversale TaxID=64571 RepID=A0A1Y2GY92_9FUNG|nr:RlpA-like double-psi beta-barrel-protein domain-containing protein-containing protein [Lobosporangium transversale]KAF9896236.1 hypothetical protein BX616_007849 [Lobosporangium transversale]ORZ26443.1 RlpA-like double-psi beta-barrel-protein domain-containing protein-containing protein [Lobosporangium transversale]|eukprot:XP_021884208.1 RlpA-like double-psi beta-barrel-protein domain-containing protein-containing protein [Lobosporangium transversale]
MFKVQITILAVLCAATFTLAAPIGKVSHDTTVSIKASSSDDDAFHGRGTWFSDDSGSCDIGFGQDDMIVAMNKAQMGDLQGPDSQCGKMIRVHYGGKSVDLKVVDTCPSQYCDEGALDLSQAAFKKLAGGLSKGVLPLKWEFI